MNFPQQPYPGQPPQQPQQPQPGYAPPAYGAPPNLGQAAQGNLFNQFLTAPPRQRYNRAKIPDGQHVVQLLNTSKVGFSQKDGHQYLALDYIVVDSSVPSERQKQFGFVIKPTTRSAQESLAELVKSIFGVQFAQSLVQQGMVTPHQIMEQIVNACRMGTVFMYLETERSKSQLAKGVSYDEAYINHDFRFRLPQAMSMEQVRGMMAQQSGAATMPPLGQQQAPPPPQTAPPAQQNYQAPPPAPAQPPQQTYQPPPPPPQTAPQQNVYQPQAPAAFPPPQAPAAFPPPQQGQPPAPPAYTPPQAPPGAYTPFPPPPAPPQH